MKLQVLQDKLAKSLNISSRFIGVKAQLPVLSNILLSASKNSLNISSTNLDTSISISIGAKIEKEGEITVPARAFSDLIGNIKNETIEISSEKEKIIVSSGKFKSTIAGMNSSDFPDIPKNIGKNSIKISSEDFSESLEKTLFCASSDETRPILMGVYFVIQKAKISFVSTDGFRLSLKDIGGLKGDSSSKLIIPKGVLSEVIRLAQDVDEIKFSFKKNENMVLFEAGDTVISSRILEGEFPDYKKIIPSKNNFSALLDREEFLNTVKLASVFARDSANVVKLVPLKNSLKVLAESQSLGEQVNEVDMKVEKSSLSKNFEIAFNYKFLEDFLNSCEGEEIRMELGDSNSPGVFRDTSDKNYLHLIMPVKTQG